MTKKKLIALVGLGAVFAPFLAFAQTTLSTMISTASGIVNMVIPVLIALAIVFFIYGIVMYVISSDEEGKKKAKSHIIYGIIGLLIIVAMWGLVAIINTTFGISTTTSYHAPCIPGVVTALCP